MRRKWCAGIIGHGRICSVTLRNICVYVSSVNDTLGGTISTQRAANDTCPAGTITSKTIVAIVPSKFRIVFVYNTLQVWKAPIQYFDIVSVE